MVRPLDFYPDRIQIQPDGCWLWTGAKHGSGYGMITGPRPAKRRLLAHRLSYEHHIRPIPEGTEIDHLCCVKLCVNPGHLEAVPHQVNIQRQHGDFSQSGVGFNFDQTKQAFKSVIDQLLDKVLR